jgi:hypothetical protein
MHYTIKAQILDEVMQNLCDALELHLEDDSFIRIFIMIKTFLPHIRFNIL